MRMLALCLTIILITTFTTIVFSENPPALRLQGTNNVAIDIDLILGNIFYEDPENKILLIDFKEVSEKLTTVKVLKGQEVVLEDAVTDLSDDSIYEVDLNELQQGAYTVLLTTINQNQIEDTFSVK